MSKLPPSETTMEDFQMEELWKLRRQNIKQQTLTQTIPYHVLKNTPVSHPRVTAHFASSTTKTIDESTVNNSDDDFVTVTPSKPRKRLSTMKSAETRKKTKLDLKTRSMMLEIKELEYMLEESRTENRLYRDKLNDLEGITHVALIHGQEIREYGEQQRIRGQFKNNPTHPPAETENDAPDRAIIMATIKKSRDEMSKLIAKYSDL